MIAFPRCDGIGRSSRSRDVERWRLERWGRPNVWSSPLKTLDEHRQKEGVSVGGIATVRLVLKAGQALQDPSRPLGFGPFGSEPVCHGSA